MRDLIFFCALVTLTIPQQLFNGRRLWDAARNQGAKCLDGSEPHYFFRDGTSSTKWFIFYEGGGWCTMDSNLISNTFDSCDYRRTQYLGTTKYDLTTLELDTGYFSQDPAVNPLMATWNMVYIRYCDGSSFTSNVEQVGGTKAKPLYFRGARIRQAIADDLFANRNLKAATHVVIGGCSAGGLAASMALDWWKQKFDSLSSNPPRVTGFLDSSFFLEINQNGCRYKDGMQKLVSDMNSVGALNQACVKDHPGNEWECIFSQQMDRYVTTEMFALQPKFDDWQLWAEACNPTDTRLLNNYGTVTLAVFKNEFISQHTNRGGFVDSCRHHCWEYSKLSIGGVTNAQAFQKWYDKTTLSSYWIDDRPYGCTSCCQAAA